MEGSIKNLWPTPIYQNFAQGKEFDDIQEELNTVIGKLNFSQPKLWKSKNNPNTHELNEKAFSSSVLDEYECNYTLKFINKCIIEYLNLIGNISEIPSSELQDSWITKTKKGNYAHVHTHGLTDIAGVYYISTNGKDGDLSFENLNNLLSGNYIYHVIGQKVSAPLENGLLLLWPGNLSHSTEVNTTDNERLSLSFNINFSRNSL